MKKTSRIEAAQNTLKYLKDGYYILDDKKIDISNLHKKSINESILISPEEGDVLSEKFKNASSNKASNIKVINVPTVKAVLDLANENYKDIGVLNFASAKNPGGGFLNGALAQEESIAVGSGLYDTQLKNEKYYLENRAYKSMMYTDYMIYSPEVVFIRDENLNLLERPITASIITAPAVNYGQVLLKNEDKNLAEKVMKIRMRKVLALFAENKNKNLVLGAYGCGVFRNNPNTIAHYWHKLLYDENFISYFDNIIFAVFDNSKTQECIRTFEKLIE
ncbi:MULTISPECIES: TIGR02452 family protein [unclassified Clostridium]|uniref:TIGR02452 family protein n=1 Tax=unclassified Clostridium TaxID=2614128 RepID=UPI00029816F4|nr:MULTISPECIES: TIGR02452 family protein [unclassified Clostridium]EKQ57300.1 MAG: TIGR02452 family protein [Clostridium sp. Maddingley MBC34-26]